MDVRYLGNGNIFKDLDFFQASARLFDQDNNGYANEKILNFLMKRVETLKLELKKPWNSNLSKPLTPTKEYIFKKISPISNPRDPIKCQFCRKKDTFIKSKKGYKSHCIKFHKNEGKPNLSEIPDDIEVTCMLTKENGNRCKKSYDVDQIYR